MKRKQNGVVLETTVQFRLLFNQGTDLWLANTNKMAVFQGGRRDKNIISGYLKMLVLLRLELEHTIHYHLYKKQLPLIFNVKPFQELHILTSGQLLVTQNNNTVAQCCRRADDTHSLKNISFIQAMSEGISYFLDKNRNQEVVQVQSPAVFVFSKLCSTNQFYTRRFWLTVQIIHKK